MTEYSDNLTPDQYRREGAEAMKKAALYQCARSPAELPNSPRMAFELGLYSCESAIRAIDVDEVLAGLPTAPDAVARLVEALAWQPAEIAPKNGSHFIAWIDSLPTVVHYEKYDLDVAEDCGEDGYWAYSENLLSDVAEIADFDWWMPLPASPALAVMETSHD